MPFFPLPPSSLPPFHIFLYSHVFGTTLGTGFQRVSCRKSKFLGQFLCAEMTSSARIESGENYEVGGEIQLSPVVRNQANHAGSFLLSSIEKLSLFIYSGSVTVPSRETPGPCQMSSGFHSLTCGWLILWSGAHTQRPRGPGRETDPVEWRGAWARRSLCFIFGGLDSCCQTRCRPSVASDANF